MQMKQPGVLLYRFVFVSLTSQIHNSSEPHPLHGGSVSARCENQSARLSSDTRAYRQPAVSCSQHTTPAWRGINIRDKRDNNTRTSEGI